MSAPDPIVFDDRHAVVALEILRARGAFSTRLLGVRIEIDGTGSDAIGVVRRDTGAALPVRIEYGYVFTSLGEPARDEEAVPRHIVHTWTDRVKRIPGFVPMPGIFPA